MTEAKRVIVTGATGAIGSSLCQELIHLGYAVVVFSRDPAVARTKGQVRQTMWPGNPKKAAPG